MECKIVSIEASAFFPRYGVIGIDAAGTGTALFPDERIDDRRGAADTGLHGNSSQRAIAAACAAFHTGIAILNDYMGVVHFKNFMRTYFQTHSAAGAFAFVQLQSSNIFQID
jgi:hypothetical protein